MHLSASCTKETSPAANASSCAIASSVTRNPIPVATHDFFVLAPISTPTLHGSFAQRRTISRGSAAGANVAAHHWLKAQPIAREEELTSSALTSAFSTSSIVSGAGASTLAMCLLYPSNDTSSCTGNQIDEQKSGRQAMQTHGPHSSCA